MIPPCSRGHTCEACSPGASRSCVSRSRARAKTAPPALLADFLQTLEERVADAPERYRRDYIEALIICRKADGT